MPFTFVHPALVLPFASLRKRYLSVTGLVAGSIAPDFEYFFKMEKDFSVYSHALPALFWFNLPLALCLAFLFHAVVKKPLLHNLPLRLFQRLSPFSDLNWCRYVRQHYTAVCFSILVGAGMHLLWDWFTHQSLEFAGGDARLEYTLFSLNLGIYKYTLWHSLNSLVGLIILLLLFLKLPVSHTARITYRIKWYWAKVLTLSLLVLLLRVTYAPFETIDDVVTAAIAALLLAITLISLLVYRRKTSVYT